MSAVLSIRKIAQGPQNHYVFNLRLPGLTIPITALTTIPSTTESAIMEAIDQAAQNIRSPEQGVGSLAQLGSNADNDVAPGRYG